MLPRPATKWTGPPKAAGWELNVLCFPDQASDLAAILDTMGCDDLADRLRSHADFRSEKTAFHDARPAPLRATPQNSS